MCEEYYQTVYGYLITITGGNFDLAEELTQETFYRAIRNANKFREECKMSTWLCQIAKYTFYQYIEKKNRHGEVSMDSTADVAVERELEKQLLDNESKLEIFRCIQKMDSPMKDVMLMRLSGELSFREIGEILEKTENWARVTFYRGKQIIGKELYRDE